MRASLSDCRALWGKAKAFTTEGTGEHRVQPSHPEHFSRRWAVAMDEVAGSGTFLAFELEFEDFE
jgi:hypothetical protein